MFLHATLLAAGLVIIIVSLAAVLDRYKRQQMMAIAAIAAFAIVQVIRSWPDATERAGHSVLLALPLGAILGIGLILAYKYLIARAGQATSSARERRRDAALWN